MEPFPRGKRPVSGNNDVAVKKSSVESTEDDELFKSKRLKRIETVKKVSTSNSKEENGSKKTRVEHLGLGTSALNQEQSIVYLTSKKYTKGSLACGYVLQLHDNFAIISLPGGATGKVHLKDISDQLHNLKDDATKPQIQDVLSVNQFVQCQVLDDQSAMERKSIILSTRANQINKNLSNKYLTPGLLVSGTINSIEDHGYVISLGSSLGNAFLPYKSIDNGQKDYIPGKLLLCTIDSVNTVSNTVLLKSQANSFHSTVDGSIPFSALLPGQLFACYIERITESGLVVAFLGCFHGVIDMMSISPNLNENWKQSFTEGQMVKARIIFVDHGCKSVRLSLMPHVIHLTIPTFTHKLGEIVTSFNIRLVDKTYGVLISSQLTDESEDQAAQQQTEGKKKKKVKYDSKRAEVQIGLIHHSYYNKTHGTQSDWKNKYVIGDNRVCRVLGYHLVEGRYVFSEDADMEEDAIVHHSQVKVAEFYNCKIVSVESYGLVVLIDDKVKAMCPVVHLTDTGATIKNMNKRFKVGEVVKLRAWEVQDSKIIMTMKKSILEDSNPPLIDYAQATKGRQITGVISKLSDAGLQVHFFNKVKGDVPLSILTKQGVIDPVESYKVGQVVNCVIVDVHNNQSGNRPKLVLALDVGNVDEILEESNKKTSSLKAIQSGNKSQSQNKNLVSGVIIRRHNNDNGFLVSLDDGSMGFLEDSQLSDITKLSKSYLEKSVIKVGSKVNNAAIIGVDKDKTKLLTIKSIIVQVINNSSNSYEDCIFPAKAADLSPGEVLVGYIHKIESFGLLIKFRDGLTGLAPRSNLTDKFVSNPDGLFEIGDTVRCVVQKVDSSKDRIIVSLKSSLVPSSSGVQSYLSTLLLEPFERGLYTYNENTLPDWSKYHLGDVVEGEVMNIRDYGVILSLNDSKSMVLVLTNGKQGYATGQKTSVVLLDVDIDNMIFNGSLDASLLQELKSLKRKKTKAGFKEGQVYEGRIVLVKKQYLVVICNNTVGFVMIADYHCPTQSTQAYSVDALVNIKFDGKPKNNFLHPYQEVHCFSLLNESTSASSKKSVGEKSSAAALDSNGNTLMPGHLITCEIVSIDSLLMKVKCLNDVKVNAGVIHVSTAKLDGESDHSNLNDRNNVHDQQISKFHPFYGHRVGSQINCRYVGSFKIRGEDVHYLTFETSQESDIIEYVHNQWFKDLNKANLDENQVVNAVLVKKNELDVTLALNPHATINMKYVDYSNSFEDVQLFKNSGYVGFKLPVVLNKAGKVFYAQAQAADVMDSLAEGQYINGCLDFVKSKSTPNAPSLYVHLGGNKRGRVCCTELYDKQEWVDLSALFASSDPTSLTITNEKASHTQLKHGDILPFYVLTVPSVDSYYIELSLRDSRQSSGSIDDDIPTTNSVVSGFVTSISTKGCFVRLSAKYSGRVLIKDLSDDFIENPVDLFPIGKLVTAKVLGATVVDSDLNKVEINLTLRPSVVLKDSLLSHERLILKDKEFVFGKVRNIADFGVFVAIENTNLVGLCRFADATSVKGAKLNELFHAGDYVKAKVLSISGNKIALCLDPDRFNITPADEDSAEEEEEEIEPVVVSKVVKSVKSDSSDKIATKKTPTPTAVSSVVTEKSEPKMTSKSTNKNLDATSYNYTSLFQWEGFTANKDTEENSIDDSNTFSLENTTSGRNKKAQKANAGENQIREKERALLEGGMPTTAEEFERLLMTNPNNSILWIQYMTFHLSQADIAAARLVAKKALKTIGFREEDEKFNVWMALINLEYKYGTMESLEAEFTQGVQLSKGKYLHLHLASLYQSNGDATGAVALYERALKKYKYSKKVWMAYQKCLLQHGDDAAAKEVLNRSLKSLAQHKHVETILQYAITEFDLCHFDKGRVVFENLISSYPKRTDLWHVYIDKEIKFQNYSEARRLFSRMTTLTLTPKNTKSLFKKYLSFELQHGSVEDQEEVRKKAEAYVNSLLVK